MKVMDMLRLFRDLVVWSVVGLQEGVCVKYKSTNGIEFARAFDAVRYAMNIGVKVGIFNNGKFVRQLV